MRSVQPLRWQEAIHLAIVSGTIAQRPRRRQTARHQLGCARFVTWCRFQTSQSTIVTAIELVTVDLSVSAVRR
jgi:hypothetical protein